MKTIEQERTGPAEKKPLPKERLRFSKGVVASASALFVLGIILILGPWAHARLAGLVLGALGMGAFLMGGFYWACDNESCS